MINIELMLYKKEYQLEKCNIKDFTALKELENDIYKLKGILELKKSTN